ncbi:MAG TPA: hypothetical protein VEC99_12900, partial [Clostridia bacterium]|nr:hypothetical protein [Clostridia bacterium]
MAHALNFVRRQSLKRLYLAHSICFSLLIVFATQFAAVASSDSIYPHLSLPAFTQEGSGVLPGAGEITILEPTGTNLTFHLSSSSPADLSVPAEVTIWAGATNAAFDLSVADDELLDGPQVVTISASVLGWPTCSATVVVQDNEKAMLSVHLPGSVVEGSGTLTNAGRVTLGGIAVSNILVTLSSSVPELITVPPSINIDAGSSSAMFPLTMLDDTVFKTGQTAVITATIPGFAAAGNAIALLDNDADHFDFEHISSPQYANAPFRVTIMARGMDGAIQTNFNDFTSIVAVGEAGFVFLNCERVGPFVRGIWSGYLQALTPDRFVFLTTPNASGSSDLFHVETAPWRLVNLQAEDLKYHPA